MKRGRIFVGILSAGLVSLIFTGVTHAQMSVMPKALQNKMAEIGPALSKNLGAAYQATIEAFVPFLGAPPKEGVKATKDISYGNDPKQKLDVFQPEGKTGVPILIFFHGCLRSRRQDSEQRDLRERGVFLCSQGNLCLCIIPIS